MVVEAVGSASEQAREDRERNEKKRVNESRPDVRRAGGVGAAKPLRGRPDEKAESGAAEVSKPPGHAQEQPQRDQALDDAGSPDEKAKMGRHDMQPERKPRREPAGLAMRRVLNVAHVVRRKRGFPFQVGIHRHDHPERHAHDAGQHGQPPKRLIVRGAIQCRFLFAHKRVGLSWAMRAGRDMSKSQDGHRRVWQSDAGMWFFNDSRTEPVGLPPALGLTVDWL